MNRDDSPPASFSRARQFGIGISVICSIAAMIAMVLMTNYLASRHFKRFRWTASGSGELSPQTLRLLSALTNDVKVTVLFDRYAPLFVPVSETLKDYAYASPHILVEQVDYRRDLARAALVIATYQLAQEASDMVIFECNHRTHIVHVSELSDYDWSGALTGEKEIKRSAFKGEPLFTSAIAGLFEAKSPVAYFLQGHGEHDPTERDESFGYSKFAELLENKNIRVNSLRLAGEASVPEDCSVLIIAGPQKPLAAAELEKVNRYLAQGGRVLALLSSYRSRYAPTGMENLLSSWGVKVNSDHVTDPTSMVTGGGVLCTNFFPHPIMHALERGRLPVYLVWARSVSPPARNAVAGDGAKVEPLMATSASGLSASEIDSSGVPRSNTGRERPQVIFLAVAVEKGSIQGVSPDRASARLVVVGESIFLGNRTIVQAGNADFARESVDWLLDRLPYLTGIAPRPVHEYDILLSHSEMVRLEWILLGGLPGAILLLGLLVWVRRRA